ncbi:sugar kinase [Terrimonas sp.]|uniref:ROK family transcriptional regulator n=1 Tax=Terrimonas sp. TaxID=1914338 RepID=UPI000D51EF73|nr:ROK family transcriptional regulator [Terrimonas sp.]PVD50097.1 sugar kinase [Terrimonas sp.]
MAAKNSVYRKKILNNLYFSKMLSCAEISERIGKSLSLTTKILNELIAEGHVVETGYAPSSGGRRPQTYSLKADIMYTVAVAMDQFVTKLAVINMHNEYVGEVETLELNLAKENDALAKLVAKIEQVIQKSGVSKSKIVGIGISMPGFINSHDGVNYSFLEAYKGGITTYITSQTGLPAYLDNDSSIIALAEQKFGIARKYANVMVINIGWGVGLGLIMGKVLFRGDDGFAGEFSHIPLFQNGKLCSCGKSGCLETEASLTAVIEKAIAGLSAGRTSILKAEQFNSETPEKSGNAIFEAAARGDRFAVELLSEAGYNIGRGIAILIHLLNPGLVVLSGRGSVVGKILHAPIQQALNEHCIPSLAANTEIVISNIGHNAQLIGSSALVMEKYEKSVPVKKKIHEAA